MQTFSLLSFRRFSIDTDPSIQIRNKSKYLSFLASFPSTKDFLQREQYHLCLPELNFPQRVSLPPQTEHFGQFFLSICIHRGDHRGFVAQYQSEVHFSPTLLSIIPNYTDLVILRLQLYERVLYPLVSDYDYCLTTYAKPADESGNFLIKMTRTEIQQHLFVHIDAERITPVHCIVYRPFLSNGRIPLRGFDRIRGLEIRGYIDKTGVFEPTPY